MKNHSLLFSILFTSILLSSCEKFRVLKNNDSPSIAAGSNIKNITIWEYLSMNDFHKDDSTKIGLYGKAIEQAGLKELLNSPGNLTVIIPTNDAITLLIKTLGYNKIEETPSIILKNILSSTILNNRVYSYDLNQNETRGFASINNDTLYFNRNVSTTDPYRLILNNAQSLSSPSPTVRSQNLAFSNGVGHVVQTFTNYVPRTKSKDFGTAVVKTEIIPITKDSYVNGGTSTLRNSNFGSASFISVKYLPSDMSFTRRGITQFPVKRPTFTERIGSVELALYIIRIDGAGAISIVEDQNVDWSESTINWDNSPIPGTSPLSSFSIATTDNFTWKFSNVTSAYLNALSSNKTFINYGITTSSSPLYQFGTKEAVSNRRPYLVVKSVAETVLTNPTNTGIIVDKITRIKPIKSSELNFNGTEDYNIFYTIKSLPENGFIVLNGISMSVGSFFSQEQLKKGAVKYLYNGVGNTDNFILEASDFQNGFYNDLLSINVQVQ